MMLSSMMITVMMRLDAEGAYHHSGARVVILIIMTVGDAEDAR